MREPTGKLAGAALAVVLALCGCTKSTPGGQEVTPAVEQYLLAYKKRSCDGPVALDRLVVRRVGAWTKEQGGGFPVYADFAVTCQDPKLTSTFEASDGATTTAAVCWARKAGSAWECTQPAFAAEAERQIKQQLDEMAKSLPK